MGTWGRCFTPGVGAGAAVRDAAAVLAKEHRAWVAAYAACATRCAAGVARTQPALAVDANAYSTLLVARGRARKKAKRQKGKKNEREDQKATRARTRQPEDQKATRARTRQPEDQKAPRARTRQPEDQKATRARTRQPEDQKAASFAPRGARGPGCPGWPDPFFKIHSDNGLRRAAPRATTAAARIALWSYRNSSTTSNAKTAPSPSPTRASCRRRACRTAAPAARKRTSVRGRAGTAKHPDSQRQGRRL
ncbi:hypothetical protein M885DRAFT_100589 [Pelagophyceae sp. CCMP2097]|nr:hypothetical protein M885DRAFT_100589 [Pelagophyceae sp. CCMP2097]